jgi:hypothetical protein
MHAKTLVTQNRIKKQAQLTLDDLTTKRLRWEMSMKKKSFQAGAENIGARN